MKKLVVALLVALAAGGWFAVSANAAVVEKFSYIEDGDSRVVQLLPDSVFVQRLAGNQAAYVAQAAAVDRKGEPIIAGWLGVPEAACAQGKGPMVWFADQEQRTVLTAGVWGNDPNSGSTKVARRICELGRAKAGI